MGRARIFNAKIKRWLESNKIYFEVGVASLLGLMAIVVAYKSNEIAEIQTNIAKQTVLPHLEIRDQREYNSAMKIWDNRIISVYNRGGQLTDFNFDQYSFLILRNDKKPMADSISLPIDGYYDWKTFIGDGDGLVFQINNNHNGVKEVALRDSLNGEGFLEIETYAEIKYNDLLDNQHTDYYMISPYKHKISEHAFVDLKQRSMDAHYQNYFGRIKASHLIMLLRKQ